MKAALFAAVIVIGTLTAYGQAKPAAPQTPPQKVDPSKPAAVHVEQGTVAMKPEDIKALKDALAMLQLDQLAIQTAQQTVAQTDPVAKKAMEILKNATETNPDYQKAKAQSDTDRAALLAKIAALRKEQHLDDTYDWDFNQNKFVQTKPEPGAKPAK
jgi:hypothetical protein